MLERISMLEEFEIKQRQKEREHAQ
jgi:hypothetical protein